jgi:hypothetical protein
MKTTGRYSQVEDEFDIDHEISTRISDLKSEINNIDNEYTLTDAKNIKKALAQTIIDSI